MSDALTDMKRDERLEELRAAIVREERAFLAAPDAERAWRLAAMWEEYAVFPRGFHASPNREAAWERAVLYRTWPAHAERLARLLRAVYEPGTAVVEVDEWGRLRDRGALAEMILEEMRRHGAVYGFLHRVRVSVEYLGRVTCAECPRFGELCAVLDCRSRVPEELEARVRLAVGQDG